MSPRSIVDDIVEDVWISILRSLSIEDLLNVRKTCKYLHCLTQLRSIWHGRFCDDVLAKHLPIPGRPLPLHSISATDLEWRTRRALHLNRLWPVLGPDTVSKSDRFLEDEVVDQVVLMPGGHQLLTAQKNAVVSWSMVDSRGCNTDNPERLGEWDLPFDSTCRIIRDALSPDIIVVAGREPGLPADLLIVGFNPAFLKVRSYDHIPGVIVGLHDNYLFTSLEDGNIEISDWKSGASGSVILSFYPMFKGFVDFTFFADHILIVWQTYMSVFPIPVISDEPRVVLDPIQAYEFREPVARPVAFTTCQSRILPDTEPPTPSTDEEKELTQPGSLTIVARSQTRVAGLTHSMLIPTAPSSSPWPNSPDPEFPYKLSSLTHAFDPPSSSSGECTALCLGPSGRGIWVQGSDVRQCIPERFSRVWPFFDTQYTATFKGKAIYSIPRSGSTTPRSGTSTPTTGDCGCVDFDEGMGRLAVACLDGGVALVDLA